MTGQVVLHHRHPVLLSKNTTLTTSTTSSFAEIAGGTAAECAVICCCCPCGILHLAVLALYTVPAGICKKMLRKKQRQQQQQQRLLKKGVVTRRKSCECECVEGCVTTTQAADRQVFPIGMTSGGMMVSLDDVMMMMMVENLDEEKEVMRLEKEMWDTFYSTGFWRSPSQREN